MESYLVVRFSVEPLLWTSSGNGCNNTKKRRLGKAGPECVVAERQPGQGAEEGSPERGRSQSSLRTSKRLSVVGTTRSGTLTTVTPLPAVATGNRGPPVPQCRPGRPSPGLLPPCGQEPSPLVEKMRTGFPGELLTSLNHALILSRVGFTLQPFHAPGVTRSPCNCGRGALGVGNGVSDRQVAAPRPQRGKPALHLCRLWPSNAE